MKDEFQESRAHADAQSTPSTNLASISLPKGGGAIRSIGEKFTANVVKGTGTLSVPIVVSPGRDSFAPKLALSYDSGIGNGIFGWGWNLALPTLTRKTDKGLPTYQDENDGDVFILSGAEDLVPIFDPITLQAIDTPRTVDGIRYQVRAYRPRIEGLFSRIERWMNQNSGEIHWRSITRDNILTLYGQTPNSRIADTDEPLRIYSWLICESRDDKGNVIIYEYTSENSVSVEQRAAHESNRMEKSRSANRYIKHIKYGNRPSHLVEADYSRMEWHFEIVFDYGEHDADRPAPGDTGDWLCRHDPYSTYRAGFEIRCYRLCQRILMFHHFPDEANVRRNCLVHSTDLVYRSNRGNAEDLRKGHPISSLIASITQSGYRRESDSATSTYSKASMPRLEFQYSDAVVSHEVQEIDSQSLEGVGAGVDGSRYQWVDLDGEGISGILSEQENTWYFKPNLGNGTLGPMRSVAHKPAGASLGRGYQLLDLMGDGQLDLVTFGGNYPGFYERTVDEDWQPLTTFESLPRLNWSDANLRFVDLTGDGHSDVLISEQDRLRWYPSLAEKGFGLPFTVPESRDEEQGPKLVFADSMQSIFVADFSGDGLADLVRIRNGEVSYWPNLGYGRFGAKVTMDNAPWFDNPDQFDSRRIRIGDIDGSGMSDIIYLSDDDIYLYFNQSGNSWSDSQALGSFPQVDSLATVAISDLTGNGTSCLVWSSPLPENGRRSIRYVDLMGGTKPHLLTHIINNLGTETHLTYASSTEFYLADKLAGTPWVTRLASPVHVVKRVETYCFLSRNRFVTRYAYHHGYFDGIEREFRGFGMVEQWDTEEFATLSSDGAFPTGDNFDLASHVPPTLTKTWFHTGVYVDRSRITRFYEDEYYHEPQLSEAQLETMLLEDTILPVSIALDEEAEACRALKNSILRQEVYALDGTAEASQPYKVTERSYTIEPVQSRGPNRYGVYFVHDRETIEYNYERKLYIVDGQQVADPRLIHSMTLAVGPYGNVLESVSISYGRRFDDPDSLLTPQDHICQKQMLVTFTQNAYTNAVSEPDAYRSPLVCAVRTYHLIKATPQAQVPKITNLFSFDEMARYIMQASDGQHDIPYQDIEEAGAVENHPYRRLIERVCTRYRSDDLSVPLNWGELQSMALPFQSYKLAFTPDLLTAIYDTRADTALLRNDGKYVELDGDGNFWISGGQVRYSEDINDNTATELNFARQNFFLSRLQLDPFGQPTILHYDTYNLLLLETTDPLQNKVTAGERDLDAGAITPRNDYRTLQASLVTDANGNRSQICFDALGMVVASALIGKQHEADGAAKGDLIDAGFVLDLSTQAVEDYFTATDLYAAAETLLGSATTRILYDLLRFQGTRDAWPDDHAKWQPVYAATIQRETHVSDLQLGEHSHLQLSFSYSDGFGREIQKKMQAADGPLVDDGLIVAPRWLGSGWTIFNNKGKPVRQYEPFFSTNHDFEFANRVGVSPILFYDPVERVVATLRPDHSYAKVVFDPWRQVTWDVNDTSGLDPRHDPDVQMFFVHPDGASRLSPEDYLPSWNDLRTDSANAVKANQKWSDARILDAEKKTAEKTSIHAATPSTACLDSLGRTFLTVTHNRFNREKPDNTSEIIEEKYPNRIQLDIEGNQLEIRDAVVQNGDLQGRMVMRYGYDMLSNRIYQSSMEAGQRWMLNDISGKSIRTWDSLGRTFRIEYDALRRVTNTFVTGADLANPNSEFLVERIVYGEQHPEDTLRNLRGTICLHFDQAGMIVNENYDFKGKLLRSSRRLAADYKQVVDWHAINAVFPANGNEKFDLAALQTALIPFLESDTFTSRTCYDALSRVVQTIPPLSGQAGAKRSVIQPRYSKANLLEGVDVWLDVANDPTGLLDASAVPPSRVGVNSIDYNAKGQRLHIVYKNGAATRYTYEEETFRLIRLYTYRGATFTDDCEDDATLIAAPFTPPLGRSCGLQNLQYVYDPNGNITVIRDDAQQTVYFRNKQVEPSANYTYDATYRLIKAEGREHLGQVGNAPIAHSYNDALRIGLEHPGDGNAMGTYIERYAYDAAGNFATMVHVGTDPANAGWKRSYNYQEASLLETGKQSNRLTTTVVGSGTETYSTSGNGYDAHGNMLRMPQLSVLSWNFKDQLQMTQRQVVNGDELNDPEGAQRKGERTYYVYDAGGQRVRKITELQTGQIKDDRVYLGNFEIHRHRVVNPFVRETLHIMDDQKRIALVETRTQGNDPGLAEVIRFQFDNHLGSAFLELDDQAQIISYEEYSPYGSTTYQAVRNQTETPKRYRYTGKERDDESGLYYHGARYYVPWLGRWNSCDPGGMIDGLNLYRYVLNNPMRLRDINGRQSDDDIQFTATSPMRRVEMKPHVDEVSAVKGDLAGGVAGSPSDLTNKQLLDPRTNVQSKSNFVSNAPDNPRPPVSAMENPVEAGNRLLTGKLSEVQEMHPLADDATARTAAGERTNGILRENMKRDQAIRAANAAVGINPDTLAAENPPGVQQFPKTGSVHMSPGDADVSGATGRVVDGPNTNAVLARRNAKTPASTPPVSGGTGGGGTGGLVNRLGNTAGALVRNAVPGVAEAEDALRIGAVYVAGSGFVRAAAAMETAAAAVPVVAGSAIVGAVAGNAAEAGAKALGVSNETAQKTGAVAAILTGAGTGALIGAPTGIGAPIGALIGGVVGFAGYYFTR